MHIFRKNERYEPPGGCRLFRAWGLPIAGRPAAVSGQPLSEWVLRPSVLEVSVGGSSDAAAAVGAVRLTGPEAPLAACEGGAGPA